MRTSRISTFFVMILAGLISVLMILPLVFNAFAEETQKSQDAIEVKVPSAFDNSSVSTIDESIAVRLKTLVSISGVKFKLATYYATDDDATISVYRWKENYDESVKAGAIYSQVVRLVDNAIQGFMFDQPLEAGEYIFAVENPTKITAQYYCDMQSDYKGVLYKNGVLIESPTKIPQMKLVFTEKSDNYFDTPSKDPNIVDGNHTAPEEYVIPSSSNIYTHEVMPDTWVFTDALGRKSLTNAEVGDPKDDKTVAMFYWTWHTSESLQKEPFNNQKFLEEHPEALNDYDNPLWPTSAVFFWNEPIYGYYSTEDEWVLRRQAELLAAACVDTVFTDNTNGTATWRSSYTHLYKAWDQAMQDGVLTPKISYMLPFGSQSNTKIQLTDIYLDIYRTGKYQNLWYYLDGKPMVMGDAQSFSSTGSNTEKEILNFFTFRRNDPDYKLSRAELGHWGWLSILPQAYYFKDIPSKRAGIVEQITVGTAVNYNYVAKKGTAMNGENVMGRSYSTTGYHTEENAKLYGYHFAEQWDYALKINPQIVFVTGWNEWKAGRYELWPQGYETAAKNAFPDQCNDEYSRDIEPSKGDLKDNYYYELVNYIRKYKGVRAIPSPTAQKTIDISAGNEQWDEVGPYYAAYIGNTGDRDADGYGSTHYTEFSGRNDIIGSKVSRDADNVYFWVECNDNITPYTDSLWMTLYIDCDDNNQGWETFDYVINKTSPTATTATLEKFTGNGYETTKVADVAYSVDGKTMQICVPKSALGLCGSNEYTINFAWTDNVHDEADAAAAGDSDYKYTKFSGDIMDFYTSGDVAPGGRFKFSYVVSDPVEEIEKKTGCGSMISAATTAVATAAAGLFLSKKRKKD